MDRGSSDRNLPVLLSKKSGPQKLMLRCCDRRNCTATEQPLLIRSSLSDSSPGGSLKLKQLSSKHFEPLKA